MLRVLLAIEDYNESLYLITLLKKLGFDASGVQSLTGFEEARLSLNPDVVIASASGRRINGTELAGKVRRNKGLPVFLVAYQADVLASALGQLPAGVDEAIESPISARRLIRAMARYAKKDEAVLMDKYLKMRTSLSQERDEELVVLKRMDEDFDDSLAGEFKASVDAAASKEQNPMPGHGASIAAASAAKVVAKSGGDFDESAKFGETLGPQKLTPPTAIIAAATTRPALGKPTNDLREETEFPSASPKLDSLSVVEKRRSRYAEVLKSMQEALRSSGEILPGGFGKGVVAQITKEIRSQPEDPQTVSREKERRAFVKALFNVKGD